MHELAICQSLIDQVTEIARGHGAIAVRRISLAVGPLSGVEPALLARAFEIARGGSCATAELEVEAVRARIRCRGCGSESECAPNHLVCRTCGSLRTQLVAGDELTLLRVELVLAPEPAVA